MFFSRWATTETARDRNSSAPSFPSCHRFIYFWAVAFRWKISIGVIKCRSEFLGRRYIFTCKNGGGLVSAMGRSGEEGIRFGIHFGMYRGRATTNKINGEMHRLLLKKRV